MSGKIGISVAWFFFQKLLKTAVGARIEAEAIFRLDYRRMLATTSLIKTITIRYFMHSKYQFLLLWFKFYRIKMHSYQVFTSASLTATLNTLPQGLTDLIDSFWSSSFLLGAFLHG